MQQTQVPANHFPCLATVRFTTAYPKETKSATDEPLIEIITSNPMLAIQLSVRPLACRNTAGIPVRWGG